MITVADRLSGSAGLKGWRCFEAVDILVLMNRYSCDQDNL